MEGKKIKSIFLVIGGPGSGKTSTAKEIIDRNITHYSIGEMYREIATQDTEFGNKVKTHIDKGQIVPLEIAKKVIGRFLKTGKSTIIIDGFPRNMEQLQMFNEIISGKYLLKSVIEIITETEIAFKRIQTRNRRTDDKIELFTDRVSLFEKEIKPIRQFYAARSLYHKIDGNRDLKTVADELKSLISAISL